MSRSLRIALISTDYPPLQTSAAVQLRDLAQAFHALGHKPVVIVPAITAAAQSSAPWAIETVDQIEVLRVQAPPTRVASHASRALAELRLPLAMLRNVRQSPLRSTPWDLVVWYSPPIFFAPLIYALSRSQGCRTYLILRDIFPEWAVDLGLIKKNGPAYLFFKVVAASQYRVADSIGVQSPSNLAYLPRWVHKSRKRIEVLHNWLTTAPERGCSITVANTALAGRKIFVYIGNMGVAQSMDIFMDLAAALLHRADIGFLFVGRGSEFDRLVADSVARGLSNVVFHGEIDSIEIPGLLAQCHVGLVALHPDHTTHNIPGKFVSYMQYGLPVLARLNKGTDLATLIGERDVGRAYVGNSVAELKRLTEDLADNDALRQSMGDRGRELGSNMFSPEIAARQIVASFAPVPL
jgi:glycosyltransferase involved in cell wall biosynthesis